MSADLRRRAWEAAASVADPEIPALTIADLGILRDVAVRGPAVEVTITPTYSGCPAMGTIALDIALALERAGIAGAVRTVLAPAWTTDWLTEEGRRKLAESGIVPPPHAGRAALFGEDEDIVACPHCGGTDTELLSEFGTTACKSLHRCRGCGEPFDRFKCH